MTDPDVSPYYFNLNGSHSQLFSVNQSSGVITTNGIFDYETQQSYSELSLCVNDGLQSSSVAIVIDIVDENDNSPVFDPDFIVLPVNEDAIDGADLTIASATDDDSGENARIEYSLVGDNTELFEIGLQTGILFLRGQLDFEMEQVYMLTVLAMDSGTPMLNDTLDLTIEVVDVNDNPPSIVNRDAMFRISESAVVGSLVGVVSAVDGDSVANADLRFVIANGNEAGAFLINVTTGNITVATELDREEQEIYELLVQVLTDTHTHTQVPATVKLSLLFCFILEEIETKL